MKKIFKLFSEILIMSITILIISTKNVFADIAIPPSLETSRNVSSIYIIVAILLAIIIGIIFCFWVKKHNKDKNKEMKE